MDVGSLLLLFTPLVALMRISLLTGNDLIDLSTLSPFSETVLDQCQPRLARTRSYGLATSFSRSLPTPPLRQLNTAAPRDLSTPTTYS